MKLKHSFFFAWLYLVPHFLFAATLDFESSSRQTGLLELYTSEGCSSCPPADRWLSTLEKKDGLWQDFIPIALHVNYWDYIGWKDRFAEPTYSERQGQYAREQSLKTVYTPGFTYNGKEWRNWFGKRRLEFPSGAKPGVLKLEITDDQASIVFTPTNAGATKIKVNLALLGFELETSVKAGENRGKILPHNFVVLGMNQATLERKDKQFVTRLAVPSPKIKSKRYAIVAWVNNSNKQEPLQSVGGWMY
jgi:hypothetical protein